jgi:hypothetical protein
VKLFILIIGIALGAAAVWYFGVKPQDVGLREKNDPVEHSTNSTGNNFQDKLSSLRLSGDDIKEEMSKTGKVIRENARKAGNAISDSTADARITTAIKANLVRDSDLSAWNISVNTTDGIVTLSGSVSNPDLVAKAMALAMETEGVRQVISTLQIKAGN